jgi:hypothetical protein
MPLKTKQEQDKMDKMLRRRITLEDGRYLIFYTFDDGSGLPLPPAGKTKGASSKNEDRAKSKEARRV